MDNSSIASGTTGSRHDISLPDLGIREILRAATRSYHARVDAAFGSFGSATPDGYAHFLLSHARILPRAETLIVPGELLGSWTGRTAALQADIAALGLAMPAPVEFTLSVGQAVRWGALYVIEGSRLGGAMLSRNVPKGLPSAFLSAAHAPGGWQRIVEALERADRGPQWRAEAVAGACAMFDAYAAAAAPADLAR